MPRENIQRLVLFDGINIDSADLSVLLRHFSKLYFLFLTIGALQRRVHTFDENRKTSEANNGCWDTRHNANECKN